MYAIRSYYESTSNQKVHARLQDLDTQVSEWVKAIEDIAKRVDSIQQNTLVHQDLASIPQSIENLEAQLSYNFV